MAYADDFPVTELPLKVRAKTRLRNLGIKTVQQLKYTSDEHLLHTPDPNQYGLNFGKTSLREIRSLVPAASVRDAAENVVISYGMGWDMDGVIEALKVALGVEQNAQIEHKTLPDNT